MCPGLISHPPTLLNKPANQQPANNTLLSEKNQHQPPTTSQTNRLWSCISPEMDQMEMDEACMTKFPWRWKLPGGR
jgi:hypothetical protein